MLPWRDGVIFYLLPIFTFQHWGRALASKAPPTWLKQPPTGDIFFQAMPPGKVTLDCVSKVIMGDPALTYTWLKNGQRLKWDSKRMSIPQNSGTLTINPILREDEGLYQCQVNNSWGVASSNIVNFRETFLDAFPARDITNIKILEEDPHALYCAAPRSSPQATLHWQKQSENSPALHEIKDDDGRLTLDSNGTLWFSYVMMNDTTVDFTYVCTAQIPGQQILVVGHRVSMIVMKKQKRSRRRPIMQFASSDVQTSIQGSQVKLYCIYDGKPTPEVVWRKGNKLLMPEYDDRLSLRSKGKILMINNVTTADEGNYTCVANNSAGEAPPQSVFLDVQVLPYFTVEPTSVTARQGEKVEIRCEAAGDPKPTVTWTKNGIYTPALSGQKVVTFHSAKVIDTGNFGCNASSEIGHVYKDIAINVLDDPDIHDHEEHYSSSHDYSTDSTDYTVDSSTDIEHSTTERHMDKMDQDLTAVNVSMALSSTVIIVISAVTLIFVLLVIGLVYTCTRYKRLQQQIIRGDRTSINLHENPLHSTQHLRYPTGHDNVTPRIDSVIYDEINEDVGYETILETRQDYTSQLDGHSEPVSENALSKKSIAVEREIKVGNLDPCVELDGYLVAPSAIAGPSRIKPEPEAGCLIEDDGYANLTSAVAGTSGIQLQPIIPIKPGDEGSPYADVLNLADNKTVAEYDYIRFNGVKI